MNLLRMMLLGAALCVPVVCSAQWRWVDKSGRTVFSDQPPPSAIPAANVVTHPKGKSARVEAAAPPAGAASVAAAPAKGPSLADSAARLAAKDRELQDKKKQGEAAEAEKRKAQEEESERLRAENCQHATRARATLDSGARIAITNSKGEREILDDAGRAAEARRLQSIINKDCKPAAG